MRQRVNHWARRVKVAPRVVRIQPMARKWGSCSVNGTITLADDLIDQSRGFQDFVIVHELLHLRTPNHSKLFKAVLSAYVPSWKTESVSKGARAQRNRRRSASE
ncbi:MAG TPA: M48 family metallopeptidase [Gemmatimonadaceae bacterium]|nr:M48 family metallopeptidase [Gemmatimonadaceae bacterium]